MDALVLQEPGTVRLERREAAQPGPGELLLRVKAANTCGTDLKAFRRGHPQIPMPGPFGHEYSGVVAEAGEGARFAPGDEVMGVHSAPCLECRPCRRGQENLCETVMSTKVLGSYAEYLLVPGRVAALNVFHKPPSLTHGEAACLEPLSCVAHALALAQPSAEDRVLVVGAGSAALLFAAALQQLGVADVTLAGRRRERAPLANAMGASWADWPGEQGLFDLVVECTGMPEVWEAAHERVGRGGTLVLYGGCPSGTRASFDTGRTHYDEVRILSPFHFGRKDVAQARDWLLSPGFDVRPLLSGDRELAEAAAVFADLEAGFGVKYTFCP